MVQVICEACDTHPLEEVNCDGEVVGYKCVKAGDFDEDKGCNVLIKPDEYETLKEEQNDEQVILSQTKALHLATSSSSTTPVVKKPLIMSRPPPSARMGTYTQPVFVHPLLSSSCTEPQRPDTHTNSRSNPLP